MEKVVTIQKLARKKQPVMKVVTEQEKIDTLLQYYDKRKPRKEVLTYVDNGNPNNEIMYCSNNFIGAYLTAYNNHGDIILIPDDFWIMIMMFVSRYISDNSERLRQNFVSHEGKMELTVQEINDSPDAEKQWDTFFHEIMRLIQSNTKEDVFNELKCDFSTTNKMYALASISVIMNSFKNYFAYGRMILLCGINNVKFKGTLGDWIHLLEKTKNLKKYDVGNNVLNNYVDKIELILAKFIDTYNGKVDVNFWNNIFAVEEKRIGSGCDIQTMIEGWFIHFFGIYDKVDLDKIPQYGIIVPIKLENQITHEEKNLQLKVDFSGICRQGYFYYPRLSLIIHTV